VELYWRSDDVAIHSEIVLKITAKYFSVKYGILLDSIFVIYKYPTITQMSNSTIYQVYG
jgi:hypothetical protein